MFFAKLQLKNEKCFDFNEKFKKMSAIKQVFLKKYFSQQIDII